jgi:1,6-anhydro-N-acetylmuramate kinase
MITPHSIAAVGLISGTSMDGVDAVAVEIRTYVCCLAPTGI